MALAEKRKSEHGPSPSLKGTAFVSRVWRELLRWVRLLLFCAKVFSTVDRFAWDQTPTFVKWVRFPGFDAAMVLAHCTGPFSREGNMAMGTNLWHLNA